MNKTTLTINRLSSITLLKIMLIICLFPWILIDTGIIIYHLINGDFVFNYYSGSGADKVAEEMSLGKYILLSYPVFIFVGILFTILFWLPCAFSLWLWSKFCNMQITYYEVNDK